MRSEHESLGHAKSLAVFALALVKMNREKEGVETALRVHSLLLTASAHGLSKPPPMDAGEHLTLNPKPFPSRLPWTLVNTLYT
jgi:hypothetical protein